MSKGGETKKIEMRERKRDICFAVLNDLGLGGEGYLEGVESNTNNLIFS